MKSSLNKSAKKFISVFFSCFAFLQPQIAFASSRFIERADSAIYQGNQSKEAVQSVLNGMFSVVGTVVSVLTSLFIPFFVSLADGLYSIMASMGMTLDSIIYGRVFNSSFMTDGIAMFTYDTTAGNIYGITSLTIYSVLSSIVFLVAVARLLTALVSFLYTSGGPQKREELKNQVTGFIIAMLSIALAPAILDIALYIRDIALYQVGMISNSMVSEVADSGALAVKVELSKPIITKFFSIESEASLINQFRRIADNNLINSLMYLGSVVMTIYFAFTYVGVALSMVALVGFLPVAIVYNNFERGILGSWLKAMFGVLILPVIDASLLIVPIMAGALSGSVNPEATTPALLFVQFITCCCVIPARSYVRALLGIRGNMGMEMAGLGTAGMGLKAIAGLAPKLQGMFDRNNEEKKGIQSDLEASEAYQAKADLLNTTAMQQEDEGAAILNQNDQNFMEPLNEEELEGLSISQRAMARSENLERGIGRANIEANNLQTVMDENLAEELSLDEKIRQTDSMITSLAAQKAALNPKDPDQKDAIRNLDQQIAGQRDIRNDYVAQKATYTARRMEAGEERKKILQSTRDASNVLSQMQRNNTAMNATPEAEMLDRMATIENFESPAFKNISAERKAQLYEDRASVREEQRVSGNRAQAVGMAATAAIGTGVGFMAGPVGQIITGQAVSTVGELAGRPSSSFMKERSDMLSEAYVNSASTYTGLDSIRAPETAPAINREKYPDTTYKTESAPSYEATNIVMDYSDQSLSADYDQSEIADAVFADIWNQTSADPSKAQLMRGYIQSNMPDIYSEARTVLNNDNINTETENLLDAYVANRIEDHYGRFASVELAKEDPNYDQVHNRIEAEAYSKYDSFRNEAIRRMTENFINDQVTSFKVSLYEKMERDGLIDIEKYQQINPDINYKLIKDNIGKSDNSSGIYTFIERNLKAKNLLPKEGGTTEHE